jgi:acetyl-CoA synthetase
MSEAAAAAAGRTSAADPRQTAPYRYPRIVDFADELPETASGKVHRVCSGTLARLGT